MKYGELMKRQDEIKEQMKELKEEQYKIEDEIIRWKIGECATLLKEMIDNVEERYAIDILEDIIDTMDRFGCGDKTYKVIDCTKSFVNGSLMSDCLNSNYAFLIRDVNTGVVDLWGAVELLNYEAEERSFLKDDYEAERVCNVIYDWSVGER